MWKLTFFCYRSGRSKKKRVPPDLTPRSLGVKSTSFRFWQRVGGKDKKKMHFSQKGDGMKQHKLESKDSVGCKRSSRTPTVPPLKKSVFTSRPVLQWMLEKRSACVNHSIVIARKLGLEIDCRESNESSSSSNPKWFMTMAVS